MEIHQLLVQFEGNFGALINKTARSPQCAQVLLCEDRTITCMQNLVKS